MFSWENADGTKLQGEGVTCNISDMGAYVFTRECPPLNRKVSVEIMLVAQPGISRALLKGRMQVTRLGGGPEKFGGCGFALAGKTFSLKSTDQA